MYPIFRKMPNSRPNVEQRFVSPCQLAFALLLLLGQFCTATLQQSPDSPAILSSSNYEDSRNQQNPPSSPQELPNGRQYSQQSRIHASQRPLHNNQQQQYQNQRNTDESSLDGWSSLSSQNNQVKPVGMHGSNNPGTIDANINAKFQTISNSTFALNSNPQIDTFSDGSGNGPIPNSRQSAGKFDDTEEGDDDEDEEDDDYNYKDSGSGHEQPQAKNPDPALVLANNVIKKPASDEGDFYLPFRPPANTSGSPPTTQLPNRYVSRQPFDPILNSSRPTSSQANSRDVTRVSTSASPDNILPLQDLKTTTMPPALVSHLADDRSTFAKTPAPGLNQSLSTRTTVRPNNLFKDQLKIPSATGADVSRAPDKIKVTETNNSSQMRPTTPSKSELDYEYEDENDDEDSEYNSNFEDNEPLDVSTLSSNSTTNNSSVVNLPPIVAHPKLQTSQKPILQTPPIPTKVTQRPSTMVPTRQPIINSTMQANHDKPNLPKPVAPAVVENRPATIPPPTLILPSTTDASLVLPEEYDDDNEDENEDDEEEEEIEDELDEEEEDEEGPVSGLGQSQFDQRTTQSPLAPTRYEPNLAQTPPKKASLPDAVKSSTSPKQQSTNFARPPDYPFNRWPDSSGAPDDALTTSMIPPTTTTTTTTTTTAAPTTTTTTTTTTERPKLSPQIPPLPPTPPPFYSSTTMQTISIKYATTPRSRVTTSVARTPSTSAFDKNLPDDDTDLTREIYDRAVEVYHTTNRAINAAIGAIWPPTFEMNSSTFEPLLNQPMLFMRK